VSPSLKYKIVSAMAERSVSYSELLPGDSSAESCERAGEEERELEPPSFFGKPKHARKKKMVKNVYPSFLLTHARLVLFSESTASTSCPRRQSFDDVTTL
jgi:hypothetical protein